MYTASIVVQDDRLCCVQTAFRLSQFLVDRLQCREDRLFFLLCRLRLHMLLQLLHIDFAGALCISHGVIKLLESNVFRLDPGIITSQDRVQFLQSQRFRRASNKRFQPELSGKLRSGLFRTRDLSRLGSG